MTDFNDYKTWQLIQEGRTKGCFQIESALCKAWCKKILPENINDLSAVISLVRPGCLSKDSKITVKSYPKKDSLNNNSWKKITIKKLFDRFQRDGKGIDILSYNENDHTLVSNTIENVIYNGKRKLYKVKYRRQYWKSRLRRKHTYLACTEDHPIYVYKRGWTKLQDVKIGDRILVVTRIQKNHPDAFKQACFDNYEYKCIFCDWSEGSLDVNHLEGNRKTNNHPDNLCFLCPNHHRMYSEGKISKDEVLKNRDNLRLPQYPRLYWAIYEGNEYIGEDDVYDITMRAPHHNFIADDTIVHNCLESVMDGKNMPTHYAHRKNGIDPVEYKYECLKPSLQSTYGVLVYQEQIMQIVRDIAGFTLQEADALRKAAGKKLPEEMAKVKKMFLEGCEKTKIVNQNEAKEIFDWIEKSQRYLFVRAHGIAYAILGYNTAYLKAHHPLQFYAGWLRHAHEKIDPLQEKAELVSDAKIEGIDVCVPDIRDLKETFYIKNDKIYFGLGNVKSVGESQTKKISKALHDIDLQNITWYQFVRDYSDKINKTAIVNLASVGAFDYLGVARNRLIYEYDIWSKVSSSKVSTEWLKDKEFTTLKEALEACAKSKSEGGGCANKNKVEEMLDLVKVLDNPPYSLEDTPDWIAQKEKELLGISITFHSVDGCDTETANCTCKDYLNGYNGNSINIAVELNRVAEYTTTKGKNPGQLMAFITGSDSTGQLDSITCFPAEYATFKELLVEGNTVLLAGSRSKQNSFIVKAVMQI